MIQIDLPPLVKRLNLFSRQALEMAASECMSQQAAEITVSHVLIQMLAMPRSDLRVITRQGDIGMEELRQALTVENYTTARSADSYPAFSPMLVEWLKEGWLLASAEMQHSELRGGVLLLALLHSPLRYIPPAAARLLTGINRDRLQQDFVQWTQESAESVVPDADGKGAGTMTDASDTLLARYAKNMTADARNGRLDPVLCRDHEIDLMIDILCRRRKNNPVVVGEAGVGKSALIEGLALRIVAGQVIDCKNIVFFLTSNLGYQVIVEHADDPETMQEVLYPVLADFFKPALLARMEVVPYLPLSKETLATIIAGKLARLDNVLRSRFGAEVVIEPEVTDEIMSRVTRAENGARMLESVIDGDMLPPLSLLLLQKMAANTAIARIRLSAVDGAFTADVEDAQNDESVTKDETVL